MPNNALIIFVKNPVAGKVKSPLAQAIGEKEALAVHRQLLYHTYYITRNFPVDKYLYYADFINETDLWSNDEYYKELQKTGTIGDRMLNAFENIFFTGYQKCVIIGSESIELEMIHIQQAFAALDHYDFVIGPTQTGGYYLLGMKELFEPVFTGKLWGSSKLCQETVEEFEKHQMSYHFLPLLSDVDEEKELYLLHHRQ